MAKAVAVAVLEEGRRFLMDKRPEGKPLPFLWEFPGGKVEPGESASDAVIRELKEEVGVEVTKHDVEAWFEEDISYGTFTVHVHFFRVRKWQGKLEALEGQEISWETFPLSQRCTPLLRGVLPALVRLAAEHGLLFDPSTGNTHSSGETRSLAVTEVACPERVELAEGPMWEPPLLIYVDIRGEALHAQNVHTGVHHKVTMPGPVSCIVPRATGGYVIAMADAIAMVHIDWMSNSLISITHITRANFPPGVPMRFNDGKADPSGRLWVGSMDLRSPHTPIASLYCLSAIRSTAVGVLRHLEERVSGVRVSNGMAWHVDVRGICTMYWIDTDAQCVCAFRCELSTGALSERRVAVHIAKEHGRPDGMCVDREGMLWVALLSGAAIARYDPHSGVLLTRVPVEGASLITSMCFGGTHLTDLYITTGTWKLIPDTLRTHNERNAGCLMVLRNAAAGSLPHHCII